MQFGPGGLYISVGDGGNLTPAGEPARKLDSLRGKILRIDPIHRSPGLPYRIPADNPFTGKAGRDEIFAYGFRNPWRFSLDRGNIAIGDVGQSSVEEVDFLKVEDAAGVNFGWPQYEGNAIFDASRPGPDKPKFPIFTYGHGGGRCAIIGGHVVRDHQLPTLAGRYIYGDACTGEVRSFVPNVAAQTVSGDKSAGLSLPGLSAFGRGIGGQVYATQITGAVSRIEAGP
jgi:glucose/arabinose dehydrogenase